MNNEDRRLLLAKKVRDYRIAAYETQLEIEALRVQRPYNDDEAEEQQEILLELENARDNRYAAAKRLQELLDEIPNEEGPSWVLD